MRSSLSITLTLVLLASLGCAEKASLPPVKKLSAQKPASTAPLAAPQPKELRLIGEVSTNGKAYLNFSVAGLIRKINVQPGARVKKGQVVAELDMDELISKERMAELKNVQAQTEFQKREHDYMIQKELYDDQAISKDTLYTAQVAFEGAKASAGIASVEKQLATQDREDGRLLAPFACVIAKQMKFVGEQATGGPVFEVYEDLLAEIFLSAPEGTINLLRVGQDVEIVVPALSLKVPGKVSRIVPAIRPETRTFQVVVHPLKPDARLVPGLYVEVIARF